MEIQPETKNLKTINLNKPDKINIENPIQIVKEDKDGKINDIEN